MGYRKILHCTALVALVGCNKGAESQSTNFALCPDFREIGQGSYEYEDAKRCVRVMAARYSVSGESPTDIAIAAIEMCRNHKFGPLTQGMSPEASEEMLKSMSVSFREAAIRTVVEMRSGECSRDPKLYDHINDPIDRPKVT